MRPARRPRSRPARSKSRNCGPILDDASDRVLRAQAELDNYRKRVRREMEDERRYATLPLLRDLLPVLDNIQRAIAAAEKSPGGGSLLDGVKLVAQTLEAALAQHDCKRIDALHKPFDPAFHQAISQQPSDRVSAGHRGARGAGRLHAARSRGAAGAGDRFDFARVASSTSCPAERCRPSATRESLHAHLRLRVRRLRSQVRAVPVDQRPACSASAPSARSSKLRRLFGTGAAIMFKGSGFYQTDYRSDSYKKAASADAANGDSKSSKSSDIGQLVEARLRPRARARPSDKPSKKLEAARQVELCRDAGDTACPSTVQPANAVRSADEPVDAVLQPRCRQIDLNRWLQRRDLDAVQRTGDEDHAPQGRRRIRAERLEPRRQSCLAARPHGVLRRAGTGLADSLFLPACQSV